MCRSLFRRKPIHAFLEEREDRGSKEGNGLAESLGLTDLLGYGIGCTVGAGIYSQIAVGVGVAGKLNVLLPSTVTVQVVSNVRLKI